MNTVKCQNVKKNTYSIFTTVHVVSKCKKGSIKTVLKC